MEKNNVLDLREIGCEGAIMPDGEFDGGVKPTRSNNRSCQAQRCTEHFRCAI